MPEIQTGGTADALHKADPNRSEDGRTSRAKMLQLRQTLTVDEAAAPNATGGSPRVLSITLSKPCKGPTTGEEWQASLGEAFAREGGAFITLHNAPPGAIIEIDGKPRRHSMCLEFMPFSLSALRAIVRLIREQRIDIVVWHFMHPLANPYVWALSLACPRLRHWTTEHISQSMPLPPPPGPASKLLRGLLMARYERMICVSGFVADYLACRGYRNLVTSYMFVSTERFRPDGVVRARVRAELGLEGSFVVLCAGHVIAEKGFDVAIEAVARLPADTVLLVAGSGPALAGLEARAVRLALGKRVRFLGRQADVAPLMQAADVLACPSLWAEAAGLVNMEAQACGIPVVASRVGGIPEIIEDGRTGILHEPGDAEALAAALERLRADPELRARIGAAARSRACDHFSMQSRIPITLSHYRKTR
jgi:glycosyltransferase involved in cell wall biosynthesis